MPEHKEILKRRTEVADDSFEPLQILGEEPAMRVAKHDAACRLAGQIKRDPENGFPAEFLTHGPWKARKIFQGTSGFAVPAETVARAFQLIPADAGVGMIEQEAVAARDGQVLRRQAGFVPSTQFPDKDAVELDRKSV